MAGLAHRGEQTTSNPSMSKNRHLVSASSGHVAGATSLEVGAAAQASRLLLDDLSNAVQCIQLAASLHEGDPLLAVSGARAAELVRSLRDFLGLPDRSAIRAEVRSLIGLAVRMVRARTGDRDAVYDLESVPAGLHAMVPVAETVELLAEVVERCMVGLRDRFGGSALVVRAVTGEGGRVKLDFASQATASAALAAMDGFSGAPAAVPAGSAAPAALSFRMGPELLSASVRMDVVERGDAGGMVCRLSMRAAPAGYASGA